ncbi:hypothetical protein GCM10027563_11610 [Parasphingorhabdus pacifica]
MIVPLVVLLQLDRLDLLAGAIFGALTSVYCRGEPCGQQARTLAAVAVTMVLAVALGDLIAVYAAGHAWHEAIALLVTALVGAVATAIATTVKIGPPGGLIFTFATGACSHLALGTGDLAPHIATAALSAAFAWAISIAGAAVIGLRPQRRCVAAALDAVATHLETRPDLTTRHHAAVAIETARENLARVGRKDRETPAHLELVRATEASEALLSSENPAAVAGDAHAAAEAIRRDESCRGLLGEDTSRPLKAPAPTSRWRVIRSVLVAALRPGKPGTWLVPYAFRVGAAALLAGTAANLLGIGHAYWAAVSAVSVLQATSTSTSVPRMVQRMLGTVFGVLIGLAVLSAEPALWAIIIVLAVLQWAAEMTVLANYALGLLFATPLALLVSSFGSAEAPGELAADRLWATLLGAVIAVGVAWLLPHRAWLARVHAALDRVRGLSSSEADPKELRAALVELHEAYDVARGEMSETRLPTEELLDASHHAYVLLDRSTREHRDAAV